MALPTLIAVAAAVQVAEVEPTGWQLKPPPPERIGPRRCREEAAASGEIVVCGQRPEDFLPGRPEGAAEFAPREPGRITLNTPIGSFSPDMEQVQMPDGQISKRILIRFRTPF